MSTEEVKSSEPTLHISELIDLAYDIAKEQFGDRFFSFTSIWSKVWKSAGRFSKEKVETWIGYFYAELTLDPRFTLYSFNNWRLREFIPMKELQKLEKTVFSSESVFEEEYEAYLEAERNKKQKKEVEMVVTNEREDDIVDEVDEVEGDDDDDGENEVDKSELFESEEE